MFTKFKSFMQETSEEFQIFMLLSIALSVAFVAVALIAFFPAAFVLAVFTSPIIFVVGTFIYAQFKG